MSAGDDALGSPVRDPSAQADGTLTETAAHPGSGARVLVVDDEPAILAHIRGFLEGLGYEVSSARDGREALERVAAQQPDLILLDCVMPVMDGVAVCQALRRREATRLLPILMVTGLTDVDSRVRAFQNGVDDVVTKPFNHRELITRIEGALTRKRAIDQRVRDLQRVRDHYAHYVPETVKQMVMANVDPADFAKIERDVTVLFVDICGYTSLAERLPPSVLNALIERYFSGFFDRLTEAGGDVNETAGDGLMVIFQNGGPEEHATHAVDAALMLLALTEALNHAELATPLSIHVGINSGSAFVGSTHFDGRRGTRWTFTASGIVTAVAARLAGLAQDGQIVAGAETVRRLGCRYNLDPVGVVRLKNITEPVEAHRILGPSSSY